MSTIYLIRHGQASFGAKDYDYLSELGMQQAEILGKSLTDRKQIFDAVYQGTLRRQKQTRDQVCQCFNKQGLFFPKPVTVDFFDEYDAIAVWQYYIPEITADNPVLKQDLKTAGTNKKAFQKLYSLVIDRWLSDQHNSPKCPVWKDFKDCVISGLKSVINNHGSGKNIAVFTSGGTISVIFQHILDLSDKKTMELSWQIMNGSVSRIKYTKDNISISSFNETAHLEITGNKKYLTYR